MIRKSTGLGGFEFVIHDANLAVAVEEVPNVILNNVKGEVANVGDEGGLGRKGLGLSRLSRLPGLSV